METRLGFVSDHPLRRRRFGPILPASIILGVCGTIAIAWACAAWLPTDDAPAEISSVAIAESLWETNCVQRRFGVTSVNSMRSRTRYDAATNSLERSGDGSDDADSLQQQILAGWPYRAFRCTRDNVVRIASPGRFMHYRQFAQDVKTRNGIELETTGIMTWRALPYEPLWPGLIADAALHSAGWWVILSGIVALRRNIRRRRGLCPVCAYDIRSSNLAGCSECGWRRA